MTDHMKLLEVFLKQLQEAQDALEDARDRFETALLHTPKSERTLATLWDLMQEGERVKIQEQTVRRMSLSIRRMGAGLGLDREEVSRRIEEITGAN